MKYKMFTQSQPLNGFLFWINYVIFIEDQLVCLSFDQLSLFFRKYNESQSQNCTVNMETTNQQSQQGNMYVDQKLEIQMINDNGPVKVVTWHAN